jgi:CheY-like chemotaxis protein
MPDLPADPPREKLPLAPIILIVDDERQAHAMLPRILANVGTQESIVHAFDGEQAIGYLENQIASGPGLPFMILLDLEMPRKHGLEVLRWLRARQDAPYPIVLVVSSTRSEPDKAAALQLGAYAVMEKYPPPEALLGAYVSARERLLRSQSNPRHRMRTRPLSPAQTSAV